MNGQAFTWQLWVRVGDRWRFVLGGSEALARFGYEELLSQSNKWARANVRACELVAPGENLPPFEVADHAPL